MDRRYAMNKLGAALLLAGLLVTPARAETVTYLHTDLLGSVVLETDQNRNVVARYEYEPYGLPRQAIAEQPGYTGHVHDAGSGLVYMQQRYYDPEVGQFLSVDPVPSDTATGWNFNRYNYAANNPYTFVDPDGRQVVIPWGAIGQIAAERGGQAAIASQLDSPVPGPGDVVGAIILVGAVAEIGYKIYQANTEGGNSNPYDGPVDEPVVVVDGDGNAIPVGSGERIDSSPSGDYQQVKDGSGKPTGTRLDKGGHQGSSDPKAQAPHGHQPGVTDDSGNPHLPLNEPKPDPKL